MNNKCKGPLEIEHHTREDLQYEYFGVKPGMYLRVNDTVGHITCHVCALKSHILQTRLTGHTTCKTCAPEVTNRSAVPFFVKTHQAPGT
jgi:hypothetical protein